MRRWIGTVDSRPTTRSMHLESHNQSSRKRACSLYAYCSVATGLDKTLVDHILGSDHGL